MAYCNRFRYKLLCCTRDAKDSCSYFYIDYSIISAIKKIIPTGCSRWPGRLFRSKTRKIKTQFIYDFIETKHHRLQSNDYDEKGL